MSQALQPPSHPLLRAPALLFAGVRDTPTPHRERQRRPLLWLRPRPQPRPWRQPRSHSRPRPRRGRAGGAGPVALRLPVLEAGAAAHRCLGVPRLRAAASFREAALGRAALAGRTVPGCGRTGAGPSPSAAGSAASSFSLAAAATSSARCGRALPPLQRARPPCPRTLLSGGGPGGRAVHRCSPRRRRRRLLLVASPAGQRASVSCRPRGAGCPGPVTCVPWCRLTGLSPGPRRAGSPWHPGPGSLERRCRLTGIWLWKMDVSSLSTALGTEDRSVPIAGSGKGKTECVHIGAHANCELVNSGIFQFFGALCVLRREKDSQRVSFWSCKGACHSTILPFLLYVTQKFLPYFDQTFVATPGVKDTPVSQALSSKESPKASLAPYVKELIPVEAETTQPKRAAIVTAQAQTTPNAGHTGLGGMRGLG